MNNSGTDTLTAFDLGKPASVKAESLSGFLRSPGKTSGIIDGANALSLSTNSIELVNSRNEVNHRPATW